MQKILIIEDEVSFLKLIGDKLTLSGYEVLKADDGKKGLETAKSKHPDLILLDITMPKLDVLSACKMLRNSEVTKHIPIIMLTASGDIDHKVRSLMTGADDFVAKPFTQLELQAHVISKIRRVR